MELPGISEQLIESLPDAVFVVDHEGLIVLLNSQAEHLFGFSRAEILGKPIETLVPEHVRPAHPGYRTRYITDAQVRPMGAGLDLSGRRKDGSQFSAEISLSAIETQDGRLVTAVVRDATERKKTQRKFEGLLEAAPDAMVGVDSDGRIQLVNSQAERLFGYPRTELLGEPIETLVPERVRQRHPQRREGYFKDPQVRPMGAGMELSGRRKDGTEFPAEISLSSIESEDGVLVTAAVRDVTERKAFEAVVARARDVAEKAARSRQEFLANMSHEIRTPMNAVIGMTSLLLDTSLDHDQRDYVETVRTSGDHLLTIINDILDYSKIDAGKLLLEELPFELRGWLQESLELITIQAHDKGLELICDVAPDVPAVVVGDPARLRQVVVNLLSNAVKFTNHGEVMIRLGVDAVHDNGTQLRVDIVDTGVGIAPQRIELLFDPFTQADSTTTRTYGGTGLGLAISRQLVERMGGTIAMTSTPEVGTHVSFTFHGGISDVQPGTAPLGLVGHRVLLVDDNATNLKILTSWAERHQMRSASARSGAEALGIVEHDRDFTFAILDLMMPGMDGAELGELLRARLPRASLILLSSAGPYAREVASRGTFAAVLSKPAKQQRLFELMATLLQPGALVPGTRTIERSPFELPANGRPLSILVVEDTPVNQKVARHLLARFGFRADVAASGHEAVSALEQRNYDLVFMDVQMPEMDGLEATRIIRERWPNRAVTIVAMTANVGAEDMRRCREAGMDDFLGKPIVVEDLSRVLGTLSSRESAAPASTEVVVIDPLAVARLCSQIGPDTVREIADMFLSELALALPALDAACRAEDRQVLAATAHRLKSSARSLGAVGIGGVLHDLEQRAEGDEWPVLTERVTQVVGLHEPTKALLLKEIPSA